MKQSFQNLLQKYNTSHYLHTDPICLVHHYEDPQDIELVGLIVALYSYGKVASILKFLRKLLDFLGAQPSSLMLDRERLRWHLRFHASQFPSSYRFQTTQDHQSFLLTLSTLLQSRKENKPFFEQDFLTKMDGKVCNIQELQMGFGIQNFQKIFLENFSGKITPGIQFLVGNPNSPTPKKRYSLFLRWMVGTIYPDFHLYQNYPIEGLVFPLDTHIHKMMKVLGFSSKTNPTRRDLVEFTQYLNSLLGENAVHYDFALSRLGILEKCQAKWIPSICNHCTIQTICQFYPSQKVSQPTPSLL